MKRFQGSTMKSRQLLSVVLSLILVFGVSAGSAYAQTDDDIDNENSMENDSFDDDTFEDEHDDDRNEDDDVDDDRNYKHYDLEDRLEEFCEMTDEEKEALFDDHPRIAQFKDRLANYCELSEDERDNAIEDFIEEYFPEAKDYDLDDKLDRYCEMTDEEKQDIISKHDKVEDHFAKMNAYCELDDDQRDAYLDEHEDEFKMNHDKRALADKNYSKLCEISDTERATEIDDLDVLEKLSEWCDIAPEEQVDFKKYYHETAMEFKEKHRDIAMEFKEKHLDAVNDMKEKHKELSSRLKEMIMDKHDITDERMDEIKMKFKEKHGEFTDKERSELKMKFKDHMSSMKFKMSDERKSAIHDRLAEMKEFKTELRERSSEMTDEEKQELRAEFIEKAKDMQLAWISPRVQMTAGIDAADIECREGFSLVMKASNGVPMCLKADTALKMIEKGIAVPAN
jgi:hypothetical protein